MFSVSRHGIGRFFDTSEGNQKETNTSTLRLPSKCYFRNYRVFGSSSENKINDSRSAIYGRFMWPQTVKNKTTG